MVVHKRVWAPTNIAAEAYDPNGLQTIEQYLSSIERNRQAPGDELPMPWPFEEICNREPSAPPSGGRDLVTRIEDDMRRILDDHKISFDGFEVRFLKRTGLAVQAQQTLIIITHDDQSTSVGISPWWHAANSIQELLDKEVQRAKYTGDASIRVEIRNEKLKLMHRTKINAVVPSGTQAFESLISMREEVIKQIRKCAVGVCSISFVMRGTLVHGTTEGLGGGERYPTVLVGISPGTISNFTSSYNLIVEVIEKFSTDVDLEFIPEIVQGGIGSSIQCSKPEGIIFHPPWRKQAPDLACNGASVGPRGSPDIGSLGVWIWLKQPGLPRTMAFLTCYHVIRTGERNQTKLLDNDKNGIGLDGSPVAENDKIIVDYPAPLDCEATETYLQTELGQDRAYKQATTDVIQRYREYPGIGRVAYASGLKKKNKSGKSMDWAIVVLSEGPIPGQNRPPEDHLLHPYTDTNGITNFDYTAHSEETISVVERPVNGEWALKIGRSTGINTGNFNGIKTKVKWEHGDGWEEWTDEHTVVSWWGAKIGMGGDTGSLVMNKQKEWVGMVTATQSSGNSVYFTCAQDIIDDVKDRTKCDIYLP